MEKMVRKAVAETVDAVIENDLDNLFDEIAIKECDKRLIKKYPESVGILQNLINSTIERITGEAIGFVADE